MTAQEAVARCYRIVGSVQDAEDLVHGPAAIARFLSTVPAGGLALTLSGDRIAAITGFPDTSVFPRFGLPRTLRH